MVDRENYVLIQRLWDRTRGGKLSWEETSQKHSYRAPLGDFTVTIAAVDDPEYPEQPDYHVAIYDESGRWIETITNTDLRPFMNDKFQDRNPYQLMAETFSAAHRNALGVDRVVRSIIELLDGP